MSAVLPPSAIGKIIRTDNLPCPLIKEQAIFASLGTVYIVCGIAASFFGFKQQGLTFAVIGVTLIAWSLLSIKVRLTEYEYINNLATRHAFAQACLETIEPLNEITIAAVNDEHLKSYLRALKNMQIPQDPFNMFPKQPLEDLNQALQKASKAYSSFESDKSKPNFDSLNACNLSLLDKLKSFISLIEGEEKQALLRLDETFRFF